MVSLSLGGDAVMTWRLKKKYYLPKHMQAKKIDKYDATKPVFKGSKLWEERDAFNKKASNLMRVNPAQYQVEKEELYKAYKASRSVNSSAVITITLRHGDYMIMDGDQIQKYYEVISKDVNSLWSPTDNG